MSGEMHNGRSADVILRLMYCISKMNMLESFWLELACRVPNKSNFVNIMTSGAATAIILIAGRHEWTRKRLDHDCV